MMRDRIRVAVDRSGGRQGEGVGTVAPAGIVDVLLFVGVTNPASRRQARGEMNRCLSEDRAAGRVHTWVEPHLRAYGRLIDPEALVIILGEEKRPGDPG